MSRRSFTREFKLDLCRQIESGSLTQGAACREHGLSPTSLRKWLDHYRAKGDDAFKGDAWRQAAASPEARVRELEAALGRAHLEIDLLRFALEKKPSRPGNGAK